MVMVKGILATVRELFGFLWVRKLWWLVPLVSILIIFAILFALGAATGVGPFIYTLF
jgi:hypothetical protein